jgi:hypothetical protein
MCKRSRAAENQELITKRKGQKAFASKEEKRSHQATINHNNNNNNNIRNKLTQDAKYPASWSPFWA